MFPLAARHRRRRPPAVGSGQATRASPPPPSLTVMRRGFNAWMQGSQTEGIWVRDISVNLSKYFYKTENMLDSHCGQGIKLLNQHEKKKNPKTPQKNAHWNVKEAYCAHSSRGWKGWRGWGGACYSFDCNLCQLSNGTVRLQTPLAHFFKA